MVYSGLGLYARIYELHGGKYHSYVGSRYTLELTDQSQGQLQDERICQTILCQGWYHHYGPSSTGYEVRYLGRSSGDYSSCRLSICSAAPNSKALGISYQKSRSNEAYSRLSQGYQAIHLNHQSLLPRSYGSSPGTLSDLNTDYLSTLRSTSLELIIDRPLDDLASFYSAKNTAFIYTIKQACAKNKIFPREQYPICLIDSLRVTLLVIENDDLTSATTQLDRFKQCGYPEQDR